MGDALPGPGRSPMRLHPAGRAVVPKDVFEGTTTSWQGSSPIFLMVIVLFVSHDQNNKDGRHFRKTLTFQTETNILHHYKGILLLKLLWQNQNYQLVLSGSRD